MNKKRKKVVFWASVRYPEGTEPPDFKKKKKGKQEKVNT